MLFGVVCLKRQTGFWVDAVVWDAYKDLCRREKLKPGEAIERFVRFVLESGSVLSVLNLLDGVRGVEGLESYARVLLARFRKGEFWIHGDDDREISVTAHLLDLLKQLTNAQLRGEIEEALKKKKKSLV